MAAGSAKFPVASVGATLFRLPTLARQIATAKHAMVSRSAQMHLAVSVVNVAAFGPVCSKTSRMLSSMVR